MRQSLLLVLLVALTGCFEQTEKVTLNPDGSGKCEMNLVLNLGLPPQFLVKNPVQLPPDVAARKLAMEVIANAKGVEAWTNVSYEFIGGANMRFKGTAYFKDISEFSIPQTAVLDPAWAKDDRGGMVLSLRTTKMLELNNAEPPQTQPSDDEIKDGMKKARDTWQEQKQTVGAGYSQLKIDLTYLLPGKAEDLSSFQPVAGGVRLLVEGKKVPEGMDKLLADDAALTAAIKRGWQPGDAPDREMMNEFMLGKKGKINISARVTGELKPLFDYAAEAKEAGRNQAEMLKKAGLVDEDPTKQAPPMDNNPIVPKPVP